MKITKIDGVSHYKEKEKGVLKGIDKTGAKSYHFYVIMIRVQKERIS